MSQKPPFLIDDTDESGDLDIDTWYTKQKMRHLAGFVETEVLDISCPCPDCPGDGGDVKWRRRNSAYADDKLNWLLSCEKCWQYDTDRLQNDWDEYYSLIM